MSSTKSPTGFRELIFAIIYSSQLKAGAVKNKPFLLNQLQLECKYQTGMQDHTQLKLRNNNNNNFKKKTRLVSFKKESLKQAECKIQMKSEKLKGKKNADHSILTLELSHCLQ